MKRKAALLLCLIFLCGTACAEVYCCSMWDCFLPDFLFNSEGELLWEESNPRRITFGIDWFYADADTEGKSWLIDGEGKRVSDREFANFYEATPTRIIHYESVTQNEFRFGLIDEQAQDVIPLKYSNLQCFSNDRFYTVASDGRIILIHSDGSEHPTDKYLDPPEPDWPTYNNTEYDLLPAFDESREKMGYIDPDGNWAIEPAFRYAEAFEKGLARVYGDDMFDTIGLIDTEGNMLVPMQYSMLRVGHSVIAMHPDSNRYDVYSLDGRLLFSHDGLIDFWGPGFYSGEKGLLDASGNVIMSLPRAYKVYDGSCLVPRGNLMYVNDEDGQSYLLSQNYELLSPGYASIDYGCAADDCEIYIVSEGETQVTGTDDKAGSGCGKDSYIRTVGARLYGLIDWNGNVIVPCRYESIHHVDESPYFACYASGMIQVLDTAGTLLLEFPYDGYIS